MVFFKAGFFRFFRVNVKVWVDVKVLSRVKLDSRLKSRVTVKFCIEFEL